MSYGQFLSYNVIGGTMWVAVATIAGYFFGNIPFVRENFSLVVLGIVLVSVVPMLVPIVKNKLSKKN